MLHESLALNRLQLASVYLIKSAINSQISYISLRLKKSLDILEYFYIFLELS